MAIILRKKFQLSSAEISANKKRRNSMAHKSIISRDVNGVSVHPSGMRTID